VTCPEQEMIDNQVKKLITIALVVKLTVFLVIILAYVFLPFNSVTYNPRFVYPPGEQITIISAFKTWDAQHYLFLAENGYPERVTQRTAFYPLYPFLIRAVGFIFLGNTLAAGLLISNLCSILAVVYFYLLVKKLYNDTIAFTASLCMISFVTFFYTSLVYSEALFLLLVTGFFYYFYEKKFYPSVFLCVLIPLTRPTGILVILPVFAYVVIGNPNG
jgi:Gpi18-like mannosyltransferase